MVFIDAAAYIRTAKMEGSVQFSILHIPKSADLCSTSADSSPIDLAGVPSEYHEFAVMSLQSLCMPRDTLSHHLRLPPIFDFAFPVTFTFALALALKSQFGRRD
jgi:hypothetical protein